VAKEDQVWGRRVLEKGVSGTSIHGLRYDSVKATLGAGWWENRPLDAGLPTKGFATPTTLQTSQESARPRRYQSMQDCSCNPDEPGTAFAGGGSSVPLGRLGADALVVAAQSRFNPKLFG
jgi:hypothetical protein